MVLQIADFRVTRKPPSRSRRVLVGSHTDQAIQGRRYTPLKAAKEAEKREGWDEALPRFRAQLHDNLYSVRDGQPSGGLVPAMALAEIEKLAKEDLKRSVSGVFYCVVVHHFTNSPIRQQPLRGRKAGEGKRSRDVEDYLRGLLGAIHRVMSTPKPDASESDEDDTSVATLARRKCFFSFVSIRPSELMSIGSRSCGRARGGTRGREPPADAPSSAVPV